VDLLTAVTVSAVLVVVAALLLMAMLAAEAATAGASLTGMAGEPVAEAIAEAEATQTATSWVPHAVATTPVAELKKYDARSPPWQKRTTTSPPSLLDFAIYCSQKKSSLWGSPSMMRSKT
jgi:hypothetical protein